MSAFKHVSNAGLPELPAHALTASSSAAHFALPCACTQHAYAPNSLLHADAMQYEPCVLSHCMQSTASPAIVAGGVVSELRHASAAAAVAAPT